MIDIVIATNNVDKFKQIIQGLKNLKNKCRFLSLKDIKYNKPIIENKRTFKGNSLLKAKQICHDTGYITIAEDSGLCVDALNGKPGVFTSRYAGENATRKEQLMKLLNAMRNVCTAKRTAYFISIVTCVFPNGKVLQTEGKLNGSIASTIININNGLTHDPIFIPKGYKVTMSKLSIYEKLKINHRGQALRKLIKIFPKNITQ
jgi:XTP/dITP diphosphohydrolase